MRGRSRRWVVRAVEDSSRRLNTDYIDLYQIRRYDAATDIEELAACRAHPTPRPREYQGGMRTYTFLKRLTDAPGDHDN